MPDDIENMTPREPSEPQVEQTASAEPPSSPELEIPSDSTPNHRLYMAGAAAIVVIVILAAVFITLARSQERSNEAQARMALGQAAMVDGDFDLALYQFTEALRLDPKLPGAHRSLGILALARGKGPDGGAEAASHFESELRINPDDRQSHLALGCLNALGMTGYDTSGILRSLLLDRFQYVLPVIWSPELAVDPPVDSYPLANAIYHFQYAVERLPGDSAPIFGLALAHLANNDITTAREKLTKLTLETQDENAIAIAQILTGDLNHLEVYLAAMERQQQAAGAGAYTEFPLSTGYGSELLPLSALSTQQPESLPFGSYRPSWEPGTGFDFGDAAAPGEDGLRVTPDEILPQPTVKPISQDIHLEESDQWIHTIRLANIYQRGNVGFREGETIIMPNTNVEVHVLEAGEDKIVLEESGNVFTWVPADVGWRLVRDQEISAENGTVEESGNQAGNGAELGPEVPSDGD
jgi:tetratricopeptide (TPR) repeat protein